MNPVLPILLGINALSGIFSNRAGKYSQQQNFDEYSTGTSQGNTSNFNQSSPIYDPAAWDFRNELMARILGRGQLSDPRTAAAALTTSNVQNLNNTAALQRQVLENLMRQRGLGYSPMGATMLGNFDTSRVAQAANLYNQQPLLQRQFEQENENILNARQQLGQQLFSMIPYSQQNEGFQNIWQQQDGRRWGTSQGVNTNPANKLGGLFSSLGNNLAYLYGRGTFDSPNLFQSLPSNRQIPYGTSTLPAWMPKLNVP